MSRELDNILNVEPTPIPERASAQEVVKVVQDNYDLTFPENKELLAESEVVPDKFDEDFEDVRQEIKTVIEETSKNVMKLSLIAQESEKAYDFSALAQLTKVLLEANRQLLEVFHLKKGYYKNTGKDTTKQDINPNIQIQNAVFTGTTADFKKWIEEQKRG